MNSESLYRSSDEKVVAGVCAGIAHKFNLNKTGLRWVVALVALFASVTALPFIVYAILWAVLKERPTAGVVDA
jgi:phage shock protein C